MLPHLHHNYNGQMSPQEPPEPNADTVDKPLPGLTILYSFITPQQQQQLIDRITQQEWNLSLKRRTQHYGYEYSYDRKSVAVKTKQIPNWCQWLKQHIQTRISQVRQPLEFDQMIINEYQPGQGINPHVDNVDLFAEVVVSVSLASDSMMVFENQHGHAKVEVGLKRRSLMMMQGEARYQWKHSIPSRKKDSGVSRGVRYSLTYRKMKTE